MSVEAADDRAREALRGVHETRLELVDLKSELAAIASSVNALVRVLRWIGGPVVIAVLVDLARGAVAWIATLHH